MSNTLFTMTCPECGKKHKVTESQGLVVCECGNTVADERYFKLTAEGELVARWKLINYSLKNIELKDV